MRLIISPLRRGARLGQVSNTRRYHDDATFGYRVPVKYTLPDYTQKELDNRNANAPLLRYVESVRRHGHRAANVDPLGLMDRDPVSALDPFRYGLKNDVQYPLNGILHVPPSVPSAPTSTDPPNPPPREETGEGTPVSLDLDTIRRHLIDTYVDKIGYEYMHCPNKDERLWFSHHVETGASSIPIPMDVKRRKKIWKLLARSEELDRFLGKKFPNLKRYGCEGAESMLPALDSLFELSTNHGVESIVLALPHRGRLSLLCDPDLLGYSPTALFAKIKGKPEFDPATAPGATGDVISHLAATRSIPYGEKNVKVEILQNPSHLEVSWEHGHDCVDEGCIIPLNEAKTSKGRLELANSSLSEMAVLGFEVGMSWADPNLLPIWEAQFGDFMNSAQSMIDTFVVGAQAEWLKQSGLVMMLPHGYDGAGPEHSSCKIERFLQLSDDDYPDRDSHGDVNLLVAVPSTPAQLFHLLRRQMLRNYRKPLIIASPKGLLRSPVAASPLSEMGPGTSFQPVIDFDTDPEPIERLVFCTGKHYYTLLEALATHPDKLTTALIRIEQLSPFPHEEVEKVMERYPNVGALTWAQEEPANQGAWPFCSPRLAACSGVAVGYAGRRTMPTVATGVGEWHKREVEETVKAALG